jgi:hypothetical protein
MVASTLERNPRPCVCSETAQGTSSTRSPAIAHESTDQRSRTLFDLVCVKGAIRVVTTAWAESALFNTGVTLPDPN